MSIYCLVVLFDIIERRGGSRRGYFLAPFWSFARRKASTRSGGLPHSLSSRAPPSPPPPPLRLFLVASTMPTVDLAIGGLIQCMEAASLGMPFEVWKTRMGSHRSEGTLEAFRTIYRTGGVKAFWAGTGPKMFESASKVRGGRDTPGGDALNPSRPRARLDPPRARRIRESTVPLSRAPGERGRGRQQMLFFVTAVQPRTLVRCKRKKTTRRD